MPRRLVAVAGSQQAERTVRYPTGLIADEPAAPACHLTSVTGVSARWTTLVAVEPSTRLGGVN